MHLTCTNMPVKLIDEALEVRGCQTSHQACLEHLTLTRHLHCRAHESLAVTTFSHCVVILLLVKRSGLPPRAGSITRSTSFATFARSMVMISILGCVTDAV